MKHYPDEPFRRDFEQWDKVRCDICHKLADVDSGSFPCRKVNEKTGKCEKYGFECDDCLDKKK